MVRRVSDKTSPTGAFPSRSVLLLEQPGQVGGRPHIGWAVRRRWLLRGVKAVPVLGRACGILGGRSVQRAGIVRIVLGHALRMSLLSLQLVERVLPGRMLARARARPVQPLTQQVIKVFILKKKNTISLVYQVGTNIEVKVFGSTYCKIFVSVTSVVELCVHDALDKVFHFVTEFFAETLQHLRSGPVSNSLPLFGGYSSVHQTLVQEQKSVDKESTYLKTSCSFSN